VDIEPRASHMLGKCSITEPHPQSQPTFFIFFSSPSWRCLMNEYAAVSPHFSRGSPLVFKGPTDFSFNTTYYSGCTGPIKCDSLAGHCWCLTRLISLLVRYEVVSKAN
jgi:hypothetical protein